MTELASLLVAVVAALVPVLISWLERRLLPDDTALHEEALAEAVKAVESGDAQALAAVFARRDRRLGLSGLVVPPGPSAPGGGRGGRVAGVL